MRILRIGSLVVVIISAVFTVFGAELVPGQSIKGNCVEVVDGDTLIVKHKGQRITVDLYDIDAPELEQPWGIQARTYLKDLVEKRKVKLMLLEVYGTRTVAKVVIGGDDLSDDLVCQGLAWALDGATEKLATGAATMRELRVGLWSEDQPVAPWEFRAGS